MIEGRKYRKFLNRRRAKEKRRDVKLCKKGANRYIREMVVLWRTVESKGIGGREQSAGLRETKREKLTDSQKKRCFPYSI